MGNDKCVIAFCRCTWTAMAMEKQWQWKNSYVNCIVFIVCLIRNLQWNWIEILNFLYFFFVWIWSQCSHFSLLKSHNIMHEMHRKKKQFSENKTIKYSINGHWNSCNNNWLCLFYETFFLFLSFFLFAFFIVGRNQMQR